MTSKSGNLYYSFLQHEEGDLAKLNIVIVLG